MSSLPTRLIAVLSCLLTVCGTSQAEPDADALAALGRMLYFDTALSATGNQSCASCHDPGRAFSDGRSNIVRGAVSLGDDGSSLGDRNTPATTYAALVPPFQRNLSGDYVGGLFLDGRARDLVAQAAEPFVNPLEMNLPNHAALVATVRSNPAYRRDIETLFGPATLDRADTGLAAITASLAAFQQTGLFSSFDSRYDRYLAGSAVLTAEEELGRVLFFSQLVNCSSCHLLETREYSTRELFTNHRYHNIGVPVNVTVREHNGINIDHRDPGLAANPRVDDPAMAGKFRVPSLRNVAVTGPYMHNGVFRELRTAILFYNRFMLGDASSQTNPETGNKWAAAETPETVDLDLLRDGQPLAKNHVAALEAFLRTLTDRRYEALLD